MSPGRTIVVRVRAVGLFFFLLFLSKCFSNFVEYCNNTRPSLPSLANIPRCNDGAVVRPECVPTPPHQAPCLCVIDNDTVYCMAGVCGFSRMMWLSYASVHTLTNTFFQKNNPQKSCSIPTTDTLTYNTYILTIQKNTPVLGSDLPY